MSRARRLDDGSKVGIVEAAGRNNSGYRRRCRYYGRQTKYRGVTGHGIRCSGSQTRKTRPSARANNDDEASIVLQVIESSLLFSSSAPTLRPSDLARRLLFFFASLLFLPLVRRRPSPYRNLHDPARFLWQKFREILLSLRVQRDPARFRCSTSSLYRDRPPFLLSAPRSEKTERRSFVSRRGVKCGDVQPRFGGEASSLRAPCNPEATRVRLPGLGCDGRTIFGDYSESKRPGTNLISRSVADERNLRGATTPLAGRADSAIRDGRMDVSTSMQATCIGWRWFLLLLLHVRYRVSLERNCGRVF